jgi:AbrB family looped-hinge helix DNA binding protein
MEITRQLGEKGQIVIPKDVRELLGVKERQEITFIIEKNEVRLKKKQTAEEWLKHFLRYRKKGKSMTLEELKKIEDESYDLP